MSATSDLVSAIHEKDIEKARLAIRQGADVNTSMESWKHWFSGETCLIYALENALPAIAVLLIESGADVNKHHEHMYPVFYAAKNAMLNNALQLMIERGANLNVTFYEVKSTDVYDEDDEDDEDEEKHSVFLCACRGNNPEAIIIALRNGLLPTPEMLKISCKRGYIAVVEEMLNMHPEWNLDEALIEAAYHNRAELVRVLKRRGANVGVCGFFRRLIYSTAVKNALDS